MACPDEQQGYCNAYNAALSPKSVNNIVDEELAKTVNRSTRGGGNRLLHLAAGVGNLPFVQRLLRLDPGLLKLTNAQGNTALHLAAQGGFSDVVKALLQQDENGASVCNKYNETPLFKACESCDVDTVRKLFKAAGENLSSLRQRTVDDRTCLSVAINRGYSDLVKFILEFSDAKDLMQEKHKHGDAEDPVEEVEDLELEKCKDGDTALHLAVVRNDVDIIGQLIEINPELCYSVNCNKETPLCVAAKEGHLEAVKELIKSGPDAVEIPDSSGMNVLHLAAQASQVRIVDHLKDKVFLLDLVNQGLKKDPHDKEKPRQNGENADPAGETDRFSKICAGDTPLHIAARKKCFNMVNSLLRIKGINKFAVNKEGLTALDIVRENTQYHESYNIIEVLGSYPSKGKPFMYSAPKVSAEKHEVAVKMVDKTYEDRRNAELVVAVLLATMSFTAAFTIPGSFVTDPEEDNNKSRMNSGPPVPGSPILLKLDTFKLFLIFDCVAFFLSLLVVLLWQMSTPITTGNKILFLCTTNILVCASFAFTAYGFMAAMYAMLYRSAFKLAWFILGACLIICGCGNLSFFYMAAKFSVKKARFNHLNGLTPFLPDLVGMWMWTKLERWGPLHCLRESKEMWLAIFYCQPMKMLRRRMPLRKKWPAIFYCNRNEDAANKDGAKKDEGSSKKGKPLTAIHRV